MLPKLRTFLFGDESSGAEDEAEDDALHLAAAALLIEAARLDGRFDEDERRTIAGLLERHFALSAEEAGSLIAAGEERVADSTQLYGFTHVIKDQLSPPDRIMVIEMLWEVAYANGELHDYEAGLVRRVSGLLFVDDRDSGAARKRVLARLDSRETPSK
jgi:uncharacterized tellurite resistance protein B-like protein